MPVAAAPQYLGSAFEAASPGMRFTFFLPIWTSRADQEQEIRSETKKNSPQANELKAILSGDGMDAAIRHMQGRRRSFPGLWEKNDHGARKAWEFVARLNQADIDCMQALAERQAQASRLLEDAGELLTLDAECVAPFTTGLGNEHPLENGFAFLWPYGLPYLAGSGVKGVLRQAARELCRGQWGDTRGWSEDARHELRIDGKRTLKLSMVDVLFGLQSADHGEDHFRGALSFWDVIPQIHGRSLMVEVMTPHQSHYYQEKGPERKIEAPHDSGQPNPISFLTIPPGSRFVFRVACNRPFLARVAPELAENDRWKGLLRAAFEHAFAWLGFGAKTAVGYGAMQPGPEELARRGREQEEAEQRAREAAEAEERRRAEEEARRRQAEFDALPESRKCLIAFEELRRQLPGITPLKKGDFSHLVGAARNLAEAAAAWTPEERRAVADAIEAAFDTHGWAPAGLNAKKRAKTEQKQRKLIADLRGESCPDP